MVKWSHSSSEQRGGAVANNDSHGRSDDRHEHLPYHRSRCVMLTNRALPGIPCPDEAPY
ncbi:hypothetical protein SCLCIDRAFT_1207203 [Scleroderma citrinum Foug A]|uniref:Uncharacterized protein n=1 Tax=Scleroderma citrinum Foug A TaxID=1036808 RepID=A0A0C3EP39_9AGAM|nr:hypothetical protein SCLCIDRAFT_1207203 [Scleroderma citrinum Foug A]